MMKKVQLYLMILVVFSIASCNKDKTIEFTDLGTEFLISSSGITSLDNGVTISINNQQKNLSTIILTNLGGYSSELDENGDPVPFTSNYTNSISLTDGIGSILLSNADLGISKIDESAKFQFDSEFNGKAITRFYNVVVEDPISVDYPSIAHRSDTVYYFHFAIEPKTATVETVQIQTKVSSFGTYVNVAGTYNAVDSISIVGSNYNVGDTLFVKVTGTAGSKTAFTVTPVVIEPKSVKHTSAFTLDFNTKIAYDFVGDSLVPAGTEKADIELTGSNTMGGLIIGFVSNQNAEFVLASSDDFANADSLAIVTTDFSAAVSSVDDASTGQVYIFRTKRGAGAYSYGIIKLTVEKPQGVLEDSYIDFEYKY
ncbi:MAG: hypothetical protein JXP36_15415 [Bacteroidales bacterium]|nr:hypothetical protein [Bacteroidales bacterium]